MGDLIISDTIWNLPFLHRTGMSDFAILDPTGVLLILPFCIRPVCLNLPYFTQSGIWFVSPFFHMSGMDDFHIFDPICNFVHFVMLSVVMSSLGVMSSLVVTS